MKQIICEIGQTVSNAIIALNNKLSSNDVHLLMEQVHSECSTTMIDETLDFLSIVRNMPSDRLCENTDCLYHHPDKRHNFNIFTEKCADCVRNSKGKEPEMALDHYETPVE